MANHVYTEFTIDKLIELGDASTLSGRLEVAEGQYRQAIRFSRNAKEKKNEAKKDDSKKEEPKKDEAPKEGEAAANRLEQRVAALPHASAPLALHGLHAQLLRDVSQRLGAQLLCEAVLGPE